MKGAGGGWGAEDILFLNTTISEPESWQGSLRNGIFQHLVGIPSKEKYVLSIDINKRILTVQ